MTNFDRAELDMLMGCAGWDPLGVRELAEDDPLAPVPLASPPRLRPARRVCRKCHYRIGTVGHDAECHPGRVVRVGQAGVTR